MRASSSRKFFPVIIRARSRTRRVVSWETMNWKRESARVRRRSISTAPAGLATVS